MAIVTGDLYKGFTFGDISSKAYGVYITQEAAYNAPDRDVEVVEIAGRNGAYILDKGRFRNITVSYKCGIALDDEQSFESAIRTFRNALSSKSGKYVRLEDEYNPNEYRQAAFLGGIEVDMADRRAGEFTVSFDAMPQRFLKTGETAVSVASGGTITNPTLFESHPLLQVWGYGGIGINDDTITIDDAVIGDVLLSNGGNMVDGALTFSEANLRTGDSITMRRESYIRVTANFGNGARLSTVTVSVDTDADDIIYSVDGKKPFVSNLAQFDVFFNDFAFASGTASSYSAALTVSVLYIPSGSSEQTTKIFTWDVSVDYTAGTITMDTSPRASSGYKPNYINRYTYGTVSAYSTKSALGEPLYFDLDIGEAYKYEGDNVVSINNAVTIPAQLPTLKSGANTITYDDTITQFKIVPRWWEV